jgi:hypothetical protein
MIGWLSTPIRTLLTFPRVFVFEAQGRKPAESPGIGAISLIRLKT